MHSKDDAMLTRLLIGTLATFLLIWAVGWWVQDKDGVSITTEDDLAEEPSSTRELSGAAAQLSRYGLSALVGSLGLLLAWIAVRGPGRAEWAQRGAWAMVLLPLAAVSAWGSVWSWRGFRAKRLPELDAPDYFDTAVSEGPSEALAGLFWGLLPPRLLLLVGTLGFTALTIVLVYSAVSILLGDASLHASGPSGPLASANDYFELAGLLLFLGLLLTGTIVGLSQAILK